VNRAQKKWDKRKKALLKHGRYVDLNDMPYIYAGTEAATICAKCGKQLPSVEEDKDGEIIYGLVNVVEKKGETTAQVRQWLATWCLECHRALREKEAAK
jgi:hypothetical protein